MRDAEEPRLSAILTRKFGNRGTGASRSPLPDGRGDLGEGDQNVSTDCAGQNSLETTIHTATAVMSCLRRLASRSQFSEDLPQCSVEIGLAKRVVCVLKLTWLYPRARQ